MSRSRADISWRARRAARVEHDRMAAWRFSRSLRRVEAVDGIVADYATSICGRPFKRRDVAPMQSAVDVPGVTWTIEGEVMVELLHEASGPDRLLVYEIALLRPIRKQLRSRHLRIERR